MILYFKLVFKPQHPKGRSFLLKRYLSIAILILVLIISGLIPCCFAQESSAVKISNLDEDVKKSAITLTKFHQLVEQEDFLLAYDGLFTEDFKNAITIIELISMFMDLNKEYGSEQQWAIKPKSAALIQAVSQRDKNAFFKFGLMEEYDQQKICSIHLIIREAGVNLNFRSESCPQ